MIEYKEAGVDISHGNNVVAQIKSSVSKTFTKSVITQVGDFGSGFCLQEICANYKEPVLVQSMDGVGTKSIVARMANNFNYLGDDLLSACVNDILVLGAKPLTMLDYIASESLDANIIKQFIDSLSAACCAHNIALVGGEMAQMPQTYKPGEWDFVGIVTGVVEKSKIITGKNIQAYDVVLGISSSGLHTNGYSLARKLLFEIGKYNIADVQYDLLKPHLNYYQPVSAVLANNIAINGMAHITGGGLWDNIPRILPDNLDVIINHGSWPIHDIFHTLVKLGNLDEYSAYHAFNMGLGYIIVTNRTQWPRIKTIFSDYPDFAIHQVGTIVPGTKKVRLQHDNK